MGMCEWFLKYTSKIQNGHQRSTPIFMWAQKLQNLKSEIIQMCKLYSRFYWYSKWPPWINFIFFFRGHNNWKMEISNNSHCSHYPPSGNVHVILLKFKTATTNRLFEYLWTTSGLLFCLFSKRFVCCKGNKIPTKFIYDPLTFQKLI